jgi:hypothetical protein
MTKALSPAQETVASQRPDAPRLLGGRCLYLVDFENLLGTATPVAGATGALWRMLADAMGVDQNDQVYGAASGHFAARCFFELPIGSRIRGVIRNGPNGADLALLDMTDIAHAAQRFRYLVVASADHIYADLAREARALGMTVVQVAPAGCRSHVLGNAVDIHVRLKYAKGFYRKPRTRDAAKPNVAMAA